jgi:hypothetical protein
MTVTQLQAAAGISRNVASTWRYVLAAESAATPLTTVPAGADDL